MNGCFFHAVEAKLVDKVKKGLKVLASPAYFTVQSFQVLLLWTLNDINTKWGEKCVINPLWVTEKKHYPGPAQPRSSG